MRAGLGVEDVVVVRGGESELSELSNGDVWRRLAAAVKRCGQADPVWTRHYLEGAMLALEAVARSMERRR